MDDKYPVKLETKGIPKYNYFISYSCVGGFGNLQYGADTEISSIKDTKRIAKEIEKTKQDIEGVVILFFKRFIEEMKGGTD